MKTEKMLALLTEKLEEAQDFVSSGKLRELAEKLTDSHVEIAFCGHFSAGKSSMINKLCGQTLLPSSPIPTSANIVSIHHGEEQVRVIDAGGQTKLISLDELDEYCRNGEDIAEVRIAYPLSDLGDRIVLLDTPGIDSTDAAHELATRSVLHRADAIFYVMDYNHVQSELNFTFMKSMLDRRKPVYAVVNMIDKHRESEMSFADYKQSVHDALVSWGVHPAWVFFISVKDEQGIHNEWDELSRFIRELPASGSQLKRMNVHHSAVAVAREHIRVLEDRDLARKQAYLTILEGDEGQEALKRLEEAKGRLDEIEQENQSFYEKGKKQIESIIDSANVTPAITRELAGQFLESRQPGFKTGWLRSASKTMAEQQRRLKAFTDDFAEQVRVHLLFHLTDTLREIYTQAQLDGQDAPDERWGALTSPVSEQWLAGFVHTGASASGEYTLNYCRSIAAEVKGALRKQALSSLEEITAAYKAKHAAEAERLHAQMEEWREQWHAMEQLRRMDEELAAARQELSAICENTLPDEGSLFPVPSYRKNVKLSGDSEQGVVSEASTPDQATASQMQESSGIPEVPEVAMKRTSEEAPPLAQEEEAWKRAMRDKLRETAMLLHETERHIADVPALRSVAEAIAGKANRLEHSRFTVALFGAFSAGKSSFANALIGHAVLPTSPNPTTAAINRIVPPTGEWIHGTAKVTMKSKVRLLEELNYSLDVLGYNEVREINEALPLIRRLDPQQYSAKARTHVAFVQAVAAGWETLGEALGKEIRTNMSEFAEFAAQEAKSCFVEEIALHYDCDLTRAGIELVDTPGADSINARHTGVAFNYIKNADVIVFVTYYNHAFSRADEEFLHQLGRVKDSFELDKMFFIVNASDLAASADDVKEVISHVERNLLTFGIRSPRIHALSSALALAGKNGNAQALTASDFVPFEEQFYRFIYEDLTDLIVQAAVGDVSRALESLRTWQQMAMQSAEEKEMRAAELRTAIHELSEEVNEMAIDGELRALEQEMTELVYYVRQRVQHRYPELFRMAFNPSDLRADRGVMDAAVVGCWKDLLGLLSVVLSQEMLATTLRLEQFIQKLLRETFDKQYQRVRAKVAGFSEPPLGALELPTCTVDETIGHIPLERRRLLTLFKNPKHFFEGGGRDTMQAELESLIFDAIAQYAEKHTRIFAEYYGESLRTMAQKQALFLLSELNQYSEGLFETFRPNSEVEANEKRMRSLEKLQTKLLK